MTLRAPIPVFGGKSRAAHLVWERFGKCVNFVDPMCRSLAITLACPDHLRPRVETVNDIDCLITLMWRGIKYDPESTAWCADWPVNEVDSHAWHKHLLAKIPDVRARLEADPHWFDAELAGRYAWGASLWMGSGWCEEGKAAPHRPPDLSAGTQWGTDEPNARAGRGVHGASMREPARQLPAIASKAPTGRTQEGNGCGVHSEGMREPVRQLPDISGSAARGNVFANYGKGVHASGTREPSRQLPALSENGTAGTHGVHARTALYDIFDRLSQRLRYVRIVCGDWTRVCTPAVTYRHGLTAVFLDPPYEGYESVYGATSAIREPPMPKQIARMTPEEQHMWSLLEPWFEEHKYHPLDLELPVEERRILSVSERDPLPVARHVGAWALAHGERKDLRIAVCGYEGDHPALEAAGWEVVAWRAKGGFANQGDGTNENSKRERIWFNKTCLRPGRDIGQFTLPGFD